MQQIVPHLHVHTLQINLVAGSDCSTTSTLTNKMFIKYCPVLFNDKGILSQFFAVLYALLLHHKVKFPECTEKNYVRLWT